MTKQEYNALQDAADKQTIQDEKNPIFIFSLTHTELLCKIASGEINAVEIAKYELANRGLDMSGRWVGFKHL